MNEKEHLAVCIRRTWNSRMLHDIARRWVVLMIQRFFEKFLRWNISWTRRNIWLKIRILCQENMTLEEVVRHFFPTISDITETGETVTRAEFVGQLDYLARSVTSRERIFLTVLRSNARDVFERLLLPRRTKFCRPCSLWQTFACLSMTSKRRALSPSGSHLGEFAKEHALKETANVKRGGLKAPLESSANTSFARACDNLLEGWRGREGGNIVWIMLTV